LPCTSGYAPRQRGETKGSTVRIWKSVRAELNGAWRSVRYDLMRRSDPSRRDTDVLYPEYDAYTRAPRRGFAVAGMGLVVATGVAGTYFAVSGGLGSLLSTNTEPVPPAAGTVPSTAPATSPGADGTGRTLASHSTAPARHPSSAPPVPVTPPTEVIAVPSCRCPVPPVPTPNSPSPTPVPSPSPSVTPS